MVSSAVWFESEGAQPLERHRQVAWVELGTDALELGCRHDSRAAAQEGVINRLAPAAAVRDHGSDSGYRLGDRMRLTDVCPVNFEDRAWRTIRREIVGTVFDPAIEHRL
jgi:hypothetical protein